MDIRQHILLADDLPRAPVRAWGTDFFVRTMTAAERDEFESDLFVSRLKDESDEDYAERRKAATRNLRSKLVVKVAIDADGKRIFADEDAQLLGAKSNKELQKVFDAISKLNVIGEEEIKELEKNSGAAPGGESSSA